MKKTLANRTHFYSNELLLIFKVFPIIFFKKILPSKLLFLRSSLVTQTQKQTNVFDEKQSNALTKLKKKLQ